MKVWSLPRVWYDEEVLSQINPILEEPQIKPVISQIDQNEGGYQQLDAIDSEIFGHHQTYE